jgi:putative transposase
VKVHAANIDEKKGARLLLMRARGHFPRLELIWGDQGYNSHRLKQWVEDECGWRLEIVKRPSKWVRVPADVEPPPLEPGFKVLPRRWVVERTFGWLGRYRRLSKDYEYSTRNSESMIYLAMIGILLRRLTKSKRMAMVNPTIKINLSSYKKAS